MSGKLNVFKQKRKHGRILHGRVTALFVVAFLAFANVSCSRETVVLVPYESESSGGLTENVATGQTDSIWASEAPVAEDIQGFRYRGLSEDCQRIYRILLGGILEEKERISLGTVSYDDIHVALHAILADRPEFYWLDGSATIYTAPILGTSSVTLGICADADARAAADAAIRNALGDYYATLPENASPYDTVKAAYTFVIQRTEYDINARCSQDIRSVFQYGRSVCAGYARAFQFLLHKSGIPCALMEGETTNLSSGLRERHAFNYVEIAGEGTYVDVTWGDPILNEQSQVASRPSIYYGYLCMTKEDILRLGHTCEDGLAMPDVAGRTYDWYALQGNYFQIYNRGDVRTVFERALSDGGKEVHFRFATFEDYALACSFIFDEGLLNEILQRIMQNQGITDIHYLPIKNDALKSIDIYW